MNLLLEQDGIDDTLRDAQGRAVHNTATIRLDAAWPLLRPVLRDAVCEPRAVEER